MILEFSIGNFRSFYRIQTIDFRATTLVSDNKQIDKNNIVEKGDERILKVVGIYGPNGSGKSNLLKAFRVFQSLVMGSLESETIMEEAPDPFILSKLKAENAGFYQVQLLIFEKKYRYGFTLSETGTVLQEWLFGPAGKNETYYFKRTGQEFDLNKEWFAEGKALPQSNLRKNTLFLTFASAYNGEISRSIREFFSQRLLFDNVSRIRRSLFGSPILHNRTSIRTNQLVKDGHADVVLNWLKQAGIIYTSIKIEESESKLKDKVLVEKNVFDDNGNQIGLAQLDLNQTESAGTRKFYSFIGSLIRLFERGGMLISDEIDNNFHPSLLQHFVLAFNNPSINKAGAQLLFTSHDTNLMSPEILRRDQLFFTEKSLTEETTLYSLADLKGIRNNADFARQYLAGFYGALPILSKFKEE